MRVSEEKRAKISEQIMALLYSISPKSLFVVEIAREIARDEEFVKEMLQKLKKSNLVAEIKKNPQGVLYSRRSRWKISDAAYLAYKQRQSI